MDKHIVNVNADDSQSALAARALGYSGEMSSFTVDGPPAEPLRVFPSLGEPLSCISTTNDPPPLVPTRDAIKTWDELWWYEDSIVEVFESAGVTPGQTRLLARGLGDERERYVNGMDGEWAGPVLERPVKKDADVTPSEPSTLQRTQAEIAAHLAEHGEDGSERLALMRALTRLMEKP